MLSMIKKLSNYVRSTLASSYSVKTASKMDVVKPIPARTEIPHSFPDKNGFSSLIELPEKPMFLVFGCARSGTTSLSCILEQASNAVCMMEPEPNLNYEGRQMMDGSLTNPYQVLNDSIVSRAATVMDQGLIYGEKNNTLGPFIQYINKITNSRLICVKRDGRHVVRSLINWHNQMFGNIYRECKEKEQLSERALKATELVPIEKDMSDYGRPRPSKDDAWYEDWPNFTRLEMCAWYWSRLNDMFFDELEQIPQENWIAIDYTNPSAETIFDVASFIGLDGLSKQRIKKMLGDRINSVEERVGENALFPHWPEWSSLERINFERIAGRTMQRLGYYPTGNYIRYKPESYNERSNVHDLGAAHHGHYNENKHFAFRNLSGFINKIDMQSNKATTILDVGGRETEYSHYYIDREYTLIALNKEYIESCRENSNPKHKFICSDVITDSNNEKYDVVVSQGTIDQIYDITAYITRIVGLSKGWLYVTSFSGWFEDLNEHRYRWDDDGLCFYNDISPSEIAMTLSTLGCTEISIEPICDNDNSINHITQIIARAPLS